MQIFIIYLFFKNTLFNIKKKFSNKYNENDYKILNFIHKVVFILCMKFFKQQNKYKNIIDILISSEN